MNQLENQFAIGQNLKLSSADCWSGSFPEPLRKNKQTNKNYSISTDIPALSLAARAQAWRKGQEPKVSFLAQFTTC
jgi:hypothetical protein